MLASPYQYPQLPRETNPETGRRHYKTPDGEFLPSVTTILGTTADPDETDGLKKWIEWMGEKRAGIICRDAGGRGTVMHRRLEYHIKGIEKYLGSNYVQQLGNNMSNVIIEKGLKNMTAFWGSEINLWFPGLYAGSTDLVGQWKGKDAIVDFKQANRLKTEEVIINYKTQLVGYGLAHNEVFRSNIRTGVLMICTVDLEYQEFVVEGDEWDLYTEKWLDRVEMYYNLSDK